MKKENEFNNWLDKFLEEKGIQLEESFTIEVDGVSHLFDYESIVEQIKNASKEQQDKIRETIVKIDFYNANVKDYFKHIATGLAKIENYNLFGIEDYSLKNQVNKINAKNDIKELDLLCRKILNIDFANTKAIDLKDKITNQINETIVELMNEYHISNKEFLELTLENKDYKKLEDRKQKMADDRYLMIWESCSPKEIADILRNHYDYTDQEIIDEFDDEETKDEIKEYLLELTEIEEASKNVILDNGYNFIFENEYYFSKLKELKEYSQELSTVPDGREFAIITNADVTKEAFLVKYNDSIEIVYNFYNKESKEMESYETEIFDMSEINSKEELINVMKDKLERFEEKYNRLEQDGENLEV